jgi:type IX secretion system PorP/SprF family membrane protein
LPHLLIENFLFLFFVISSSNKIELRITALVILSVFSIAPHSIGQDIHWSQFNDNPLFQNPANSGHFNGDYRFVGNYRDQWRSVTVPFSTLSFSADTRLRKNKNIGIGVLFFHDMVGDGKLRTIEVQGNLSYLKKITKDSVHSIRTGVNFGMNHRQVNWDQFYFDSQFNGYTYDPSLPTNETYQSDRKTNISFGIGAIYEYNQSKRKKLTTGIGFYNLNRPNQGFYGEKVQRDIRMNIFLKGLYKLDVDWDLVPGINFSIQGKYREFVIGSSLKYTLVDKAGTYRAIYAGLWYRNRDAGYISAGVDYQDWFVGLSYDVNFSKLVPASNARGGFEIAVRYILHHFKPKKVIHRVCPDFI